MEVIDLYNQEQNPDYELEFILSSVRETVRKIVSNIKKPFMTEKQIDMWEGEKRVRNIIGGEIIYQSKTLVKTGIFEELKLNLKEEKSIPKFSPKVDNLRLKYVNIYNFGEWQLEHSRIKILTDPRQAGTYATQLKEAKNINDDTLRSFATETLELEFIGKKVDAEEMKTILNQILIVANPIRDELILKLSKLAGTRQTSLKSILPAVTTLSRELYKNIWGSEDYVVTEKTDGVRGVLQIKDGSYIMISDEKTLTGNSNEKGNIIFDGELKGKTFYIWDVIEEGSNEIHKNPYELRLKSLKEIHVEGDLEKTVVKNIVKLDKNAEEIYNKSEDKEGLIITKLGDPYFETKSYKWKDDHTIDFLVLSSGEKGTFYLFVGIDINTFKKIGVKKLSNYNALTKGIKMTTKMFPIQFSTPRGDMYVFKTKDKKLIEELSEPNISEFSFKTGEWKHIKVREDRSKMLKEGKFFGNSYYVASRNMELYHLPLTLKDLDNFEGGYFKESKSGMYKNPNGFNSYIKYTIFERCSGNLMDIGAGKGQDINRYKLFYTNVVSIDPDNEALSELVNREIFVEGKTTIKVFNTDLFGFKNKDYHGWANIITINFAIHYIINEINDIFLLKDFVNKYLKKGGVFAFICFDGARLLDYFKEEEELNIYEGNTLKYSIKHSKKDKEITSNKVDVLLPFSSGSYYTEHLVDISKIINTLGYKVITNESISKKFNKKFKLSEGDKEYLSFINEVVLKKN